MNASAAASLLAYTSGFELVAAGTGLLDDPNLTRFVFTDPRARTLFADWDQVADEAAFDLWLGPSAARSEQFVSSLRRLAGPEFERRLGRQVAVPLVELAGWVAALVLVPGFFAVRRWQSPA